MPILYLRASTSLFSLSSPFPKRRSNLTRFFSVKMSTASSETVEHIVLFKVKDSVEPSRIQSMLSSLNALVSLDSVLHLSAGPIYRVKSSRIPFTHLLHSRYSSKENLKSYALHPSHVTAVKECVLPVCEDVMAVDWIARDLRGPVAPPPGSGIRLTFLKLKENLGEEAKGEIIEVIGGVKDKLGEMEQLTVGENFSPERAKGYSIASLALFGGRSELDLVDTKGELVNSEKDKVRKHLESVIVLDYVVPSSQSTASL